MSIRAAIYDLLNDSEADVYPLVAPQGTTDPYVVYSVRRVPVRVQEGIVMEEIELTLNIFANERGDCFTLADAMYAGLEAATGTYGSETLDISNWVSETGAYIEELDKYMITQEYELKFS